MLSPADVHDMALALAGVERCGQPGRPAFAVRGRVFATLWTPTKLNLVLDQGEIQVDLRDAAAELVRSRLEEAWARAAPRAVRRAHLRP